MKRLIHHHRSIHTLPRLAVLALLLFPLLGQAQIYRWVDENGKVNFSDRPQPSQKIEEIQINTQKNAYGGGQVLERQRGLLDQYQQQDKQRAEEKQQKEKEKAAEKAIQRACINAKDKLRQFDGSSIYRLDDQGERIYYSEEERAQRISELKNAVQKHCD